MHSTKILSNPLNSPVAAGWCTILSWDRMAFQIPWDLNSVPWRFFNVSSRCKCVSCSSHGERGCSPNIFRPTYGNCTHVVRLHGPESQTPWSDEQNRNLDLNLWRNFHAKAIIHNVTQFARFATQFPIHEEFIIKHLLCCADSFLAQSRIGANLAPIGILYVFPFGAALHLTFCSTPL